MLTEEEKAKLRAYNNQRLTEEQKAILRIEEKQHRAVVFQGVMLGLVGLVVSAIGIALTVYIWVEGKPQGTYIASLFLVFGGFGTILYSMLRKTAAPWDD